MDDISAFFTREKANEGTQVPLSLPDGTPTDHYLVVRGVDSDMYRRVNDRNLRKAVEIAKIDDAEKREAAIEELRLDTLVALVAAWSFETEFNEKNVRKLLIEAPHIANKVDKIAMDRARLFTKPPQDSTNSQKPNSGSSSPQKGQRPR